MLQKNSNFNQKNDQNCENNNKFNCEGLEAKTACNDGCVYDLIHDYKCICKEEDDIYEAATCNLGNFIF